MPSKKPRRALQSQSHPPIQGPIERLAAEWGRILGGEQLVELVSEPIESSDSHADGDPNQRNNEPRIGDGGHTSQKSTKAPSNA